MPELCWSEDRLVHFDQEADVTELDEVSLVSGCRAPGPARQRSNPLNVSYENFLDIYVFGSATRNSQAGVLRK